MRDRIIREYSPRGYTHFLETIWSSRLLPENRDIVVDALRRQGFDNVDVCHADLEHGKIEALGWTMSYLPNGTAIAQVETRTSDATGTYLCLTFAFSSAIQRDYHNHVVDQAINSLRIVLGVTVARNCVSTAFYSLYEPEPRTLSDTGYHSYFDSMELNLFRDPPIETGNVPRLPKEAALILSIAFDQKLPREQFFFLWTALEVLIREKPGKTNGKRREHFYKVELRSELANTEVQRLFLVRNRLFKEGAADFDSIGADVWSLFMAIQLLVLGPCTQRDLFLHSYEQYLQQR